MVVCDIVIDFSQEISSPLFRSRYGFPYPMNGIQHEVGNMDKPPFVFQYRKHELRVTTGDEYRHLGTAQLFVRRPHRTHDTSRRRMNHTRTYRAKGVISGRSIHAVQGFVECDKR